eukprot:TRINITY_DN83282_c0_g1_i1.p1 TRINITY_DN83282_c0_g1~~TRINITY_DN83282_c0_g1_i1.p1  ORF type:complete len:205 (+),score=42.12 TRINITY_DN83282_c0_g1_i1:2-616(+)
MAAVDLYASPNGDSGLAKAYDGSFELSEEDWKQRLTDTQFRVLRRKATDPKGLTREFGGFDDLYEAGQYLCVGCGALLYTGDMKFDCGCGWPGFWTNVQDSVYPQADKDGVRREIVCNRCGSHLGHVYRNEGFGYPTEERQCVDSVALVFIPEGSPDLPLRCTYRGPVWMKSYRLTPEARTSALEDLEGGDCALPEKLRTLVPP